MIGGKKKTLEMNASKILIESVKQKSPPNIVYKAHEIILCELAQDLPDLGRDNLPN